MVPGRGLKTSYISDKVPVKKVLGPKIVSSFSDSKRNLILSTRKNKTKNGCVLNPNAAKANQWPPTSERCVML